jgi:Restriction endonuclease
VVQGLPDREEDARDLAERNKYDFQDWVVLKLGGQPIRESSPGKAVKGPDGGVDGVIYFEDAGGTHKAYISAKGGRNISVQMLRDLDGALNDKGGVIGVLIVAYEPTGPMRDLAKRSPLYESKDSLGNVHHYSRLQIVTAAELIAKGSAVISMPMHYEGQSLQTAQRGQRKEGEQIPLLGG